MIVSNHLFRAISLAVLFSWKGNHCSVEALNLNLIHNPCPSPVFLVLPVGDTGDGHRG